MKKIREPFDLDKYNNQSGYKAEFQNENADTFPAKIIYTKCKGTHPIVAVISLFPNTEEVLKFTLEGQFSNNNCIIMIMSCQRLLQKSVHTNFGVISYDE